MSSANWVSNLRRGKTAANTSTTWGTVTACMFCNTADNRYFDLALKRGLQFDGFGPDELVEQRRPYVEKTCQSYQAFWEENVRLKALIDR